MGTPNDKRVTKVSSGGHRGDGLPTSRGGQPRRVLGVVAVRENGLGPVPPERFDRELYFDPRRGVRLKSYSELGGVVAYRSEGEADCPVSEAAGVSLDLAHVTLCAVAAAACRDAGFDPLNLPHRNAGVYVGHTRGSGVAGEMTYGMYVAQVADYLRETFGWQQLETGLQHTVLREVVEEVRRHCPQRHCDGGPFVAPHMAAALIAKTFALTGPQMVFNAACASSSQALLQAVRALQRGRMDLALVGGASFYHSDTLVTFSQAQSLSNNGSYPFAAAADGMVAAEGYVVVLLQRCEQAVAENRNIRAVLTGLGMSADGRGKSLWAPLKEGQTEAIRRAYGSGAAMQRLQYIEAHATSTPVGDATEIQSLAAALASQLGTERKIPLGSVKANIGHTLETAGLASLAKTVLAIQHRIIPPQPPCAGMSSAIDWDRTPFLVPTRGLDWDDGVDGHPRRAAVNSFGIGGLNVHLVLDEHLPGRRVPIGRGSGMNSSDLQSASVPASQDARAAAPVVHPPAQSQSVARAGTGPKPAAVGAAEAVAIVGMGAVFPGALCLDAFWQLWMSGRDATSDVPIERWNAALYHRPGTRAAWSTPTIRGGFVRDFVYDWRKNHVPPKQVAHASPLHFMALQAVSEALQNSGIDLANAEQRKRAGVVVGTAFGGDFATQMLLGLQLPRFQRSLAGVLQRHGVGASDIDRILQQHADVFLAHQPALLDETGSFTTSAFASRITKMFDLHGGGFAVDAGAASSLAALDCALDLLASGDCELVVCVGAQQDMTLTKYESWSLSGTLASGTLRPPLDARAGGCVPGEGCGALVLKSLAAAQRDGNPVFATVRAVRSGAGPGRGQVARLAISRALQDSHVPPDRVALVETASQGDSDLDAQEVQAIVVEYGSTARKNAVVLGTTIGQIGHTGAAAGMASLLKAVLSLQTGQTPAAAGLEQPAAYLTEHRSVVQLPPPKSAFPAPSSDASVAAPACGVSAGGRDNYYHAIIERGTHVSLAKNGRSESAEQARQTSLQVIPGEISYFDATGPRRERLRAQGAQARVAPEPAEPHVSAAGGTLPDYPPAPLAIDSVRPAAARRPPGPQLETFLINFIVEHTGYPPDVVNLDADLEADLGIDSIRKVQLFGELRESFPFEMPENSALSLDDFPTLRHIADFLKR